MKKRIYIIIGLIFLFIVSSSIIYLIIITPSSIGFIKKEDSGAWLGFLGSIVGGALTLLGVWWTIYEQNKIRKEDLVEIEERRIKDRRDSVLPFLTYIVDTITLVDNEIPSSLWIQTNKSALNHVDGEVHIDLVTRIVVQNVGLGIAINPYILEIVYGDTVIKLGHQTNIYLNVSEKAGIPLSFVFPDIQELQKMILKIKLGYYNILDNFYEQDIKIGFIITPIISPQSIRYKCNNIEIIKVDRPVLSDPMKYKGIDISFVI